MTFVLSGYKWGTPTWGTESGEVFWNVSSFAGLNYDTTLYDQSDFMASVQSAFDEWEAAAAIDFTYTADVASADIELFWTPLDGPIIGEAWVSFSGYDNPGQIFDAEVRFDSNETWAPNGETDLSFYAVALHEIGHTLGLGHTDTDSAQIMYPSITSLNELGDGDIEGAQEIYGADEGDPVIGGGGGSGGGGMGLVGLILGLLAILFINPAAMLVTAAMGRSEDEPDVEDEAIEGPDLGDVIALTGTWSDEGYFEDVHSFYGEDFDHDHLDDHLLI